jgi:hypothetical protein
MKLLITLFFLLVSIITNAQILDSYKYTSKLSPIPKHYGISVIYNQPYVPLKVGTLQTEGDVIWYSPENQVYGIRITEYGEYFLNQIFPAFVESASRPTYYEFSHRSGVTDYYRVSSGEPTVGLGASPAGSYIEFFKSNEFTKFYMALLYLSSEKLTVGIGSGFSKINNITYSGGNIASGDFAERLKEFTDNNWISSGGTYFNFDGIWRWNLDVKFLGNIQISHYISGSSILSFTKELRETMQTMGLYSQFGASVSRSIGPLRFNAEIKIPSKFFIVPWYFQGTQFSISSGIAF